MNPYKSRAALKDLAKEHIQGHYSSAILLNFIVGLIQMSVTFLLSFSVTFIFFATLALTQNANVADTGSFGITVFTYLSSQVIAVFLGVFQVGLALFYLNLICKRPTSIGNLFYGFQTFGKSFKISLVIVLVNMLLSLPAQFIYAIRDGYISNTYLPMALGILIVCVIIYIPLSLSVSQVYFLMLDFPGLSTSELLKRSFTVMKGHRFRLFLLQLSFFPLMLLGILSIGIGFLWLNPYMSSVYALFFLDIMKPKQSIE